jgi:FkbM family methyltransferase
MLSSQTNFRSILEISILKAIRLSPLSKGKVRLVDFFRQIISFPEGTIRKAIVDNDVSIFVDLFERIQSYMYFIGEYERYETKKFTSAIESGDVILDLGANIGYFSMIASKRLGKEGHVYAFEASPKIYELLCKNCSLSQINNITPLRLAVADRESVLSFKLPQNLQEQGSGSLSSNGTGDIEVQAITIDGFIQKEKLSRLDSIKMDIEGAELKAFFGMKETICRYQPKIIFEFSPARYEERDISEFKSLVELMSELGYMFQILNKNGHWNTIKPQDLFHLSGVSTIYATAQH